jgi:peptidoglycan/xylan/chitin deacetylase (PgdA/CDA1 family)
MAERDLVGYGRHPPHPRWPGEARVAVQFVRNIEEGAESCILNGDARSEAYLHELPGRPPRSGERDLSVGLHARISGHPARAPALARFLDYVQKHDSVWICRREEIARHWMAEHPS